MGLCGDLAGWDGGGQEGSGGRGYIQIHTHIHLMYFTVQRKLTQYCKATVPQLKKNLISLTGERVGYLPISDAKKTRFADCCQTSILQAGTLRGLNSQILRKSPLQDSPAFQWYITAKDPAVLQLDGLGCGLQLGGQSSRRGRTLVPSIGQGVPIERSDGWMMLCGVLLMGRWQRLEGGLALAVCRLL